MRKRCAVISICFAFGALAPSGAAFAHGTGSHGTTTVDDVQMKKLHEMMPLFSQVTAKLEAGLDNGNIALVEAETGKLLTYVPDLKKSKPHKNLKQRKKYVELATDLEMAVNSTASLARKSDFAGAKAAFKKIEEACAACHARFRD